MKRVLKGDLKLRSEHDWCEHAVCKAIRSRTWFEVDGHFFSTQVDVVFYDLLEQVSR